MLMHIGHGHGRTLCFWLFSHISSIVRNFDTQWSAIVRVEVSNWQKNLLKFVQVIVLMSIYPFIAATVPFINLPLFKSLFKFFNSNESNQNLYILSTKTYFSKTPSSSNFTFLSICDEHHKALPTEEYHLFVQSEIPFIFLYYFL